MIEIIYQMAFKTTLVSGCFNVGHCWVAGLWGSVSEFTNDYRVFFSSDNPQLNAFENLQDTYTKNDNILIMFKPKSGKSFDPEVLEAVTNMTEDAWQTPYSIRVGFFV